MSAMLELQDITIQFSHNTLFNELNLVVNKGEICCIRTGVLDGGSTLLKCCAGLILPTSGQVHLEGKNIDQYSDGELFRKVSYCQENAGLISIFSNYNNLLLPINYHLQINSKILAARIKDIAEKFGLSDVLNKEPYQLNDVQISLFTLVRALTIESEIILLDELQSGMSEVMRQRVLELIRAYSDEYGYTFIMTTTAGDDLSFADRVFSIKNQQLMED
jgi:ABC-type transporter Mla maintaining outer membrane lipid asymmetry ATPase subunit MlaF